VVRFRVDNPSREDIMTTLRSAVRTLFTLTFLAAVFALATPPEAGAVPAMYYRLALIRVSYSDASTSVYSDLQMTQAAAEMRQFYAQLSNGQIDVDVVPMKATLGHPISNYWGDGATGFLAGDAAEGAVLAGHSFAGVDGISILSPYDGGDYMVDAVTISRPTVSGTFQLAYDFESVPSDPSYYGAPGPAGVWWGAWVHEVGHQLENVFGTDWSGTWTGHPSGYSSGYDLMDSCYPCGQSAYELSGPPIMNGPKKVFPNWLDSSRVLELTPLVGVDQEVVLEPMSTPAEILVSRQAIKIPIGGSLSRYVLVQARSRARADSLAIGVGIYDEGVQIREIDEYADPPVKNVMPCDQATDPGQKCITDWEHDPRSYTCIKSDGHYARSADEVPGYCWPHSLWHPGQTYNAPNKQFRITIGAANASEYRVTVRGTTGTAGAPDLFITPWSTPPLNVRESVDVWIDGSCNGYENPALKNGVNLKYGRRIDGTVYGNGDNPCANHENRIYARVWNVGEAPAQNVKVKFFAPEGAVKMVGLDSESVVGVANSAAFPALASLAPGQSTEVWVPWTPVVADADMAADFSFATTVRVAVESVAGEKIINNQSARENFGNIQWIGDIHEPIYTIPPMKFKNWADAVDHWRDPRVRKPLDFYVGIRSDLTADYRVGLSGMETKFVLNKRKSLFIPLELAFTDASPAIPGLSTALPDGDQAEGAPERMRGWVPGESHFLTMQVATPIKTIRKAVPPGLPYRVHYDSKVLAGHTFTVQRVLASTISLRVDNNETGGIQVVGSLPGQTGTIVSLEYLNTTRPGGRFRRDDRVSRQVQVTDGVFSDSFDPKYPGEWSVQAVWQGTQLYASAVSAPAVVTVLPYGCNPAKTDPVGEPLRLNKGGTPPASGKGSFLTVPGRTYYVCVDNGLEDGSLRTTGIGFRLGLTQVLTPLNFLPASDPQRHVAKKLFTASGAARTINWSALLSGRKFPATALFTIRAGR
jgi:hypothetical protein